MNALIISDSHANTALLKSVLQTARALMDFEQIWHLGDEYEDMDYIDFEGIIKRVPGTRHHGYYSGALPKFLSFPFGEAQISLVHSPYDIPKQMIGQKRFFFYGHLHRPGIEQCGDGILLSPGHIKCEYDRGFQASFMIAQFSAKTRITLYDCFGNFCREATVEDLGQRYELLQNNA